MSSMSKLLTVFGATGVQGGSVVKAVLAHPVLTKEYRVRAVTRDPSKPSAQMLVSLGVEAVKGDLDDSDSIKKAVSGSHAVFAVTDFWEKATKENEVKQGKVLADACKAEHVQHLVWSGLANVTKLTRGALSHVDHFDSKAEVAEYIETIKADMNATYFMPGFYMSNFKNFVQVQDGTPTLAMPWDGDHTQVPLFDAAVDTGKFVAGILLADPAKINGVWVQAVSEWCTPNQIVASLSKAGGREVKLITIPADVFKGFMPPAVATILTENMLLVRDYSYYGIGTEKEQPKHNEILGDMKPNTFDEFVANNGPWKWE